MEIRVICDKIIINSESGDDRWMMSSRNHLRLPEMSVVSSSLNWLRDGETTDISGVPLEAEMNG